MIDGIKEGYDEVDKRIEAALEKRRNVKKDFAAIINKYSLENISNTPDFILAEYLYECLDSFCMASLKREDWFGEHLTIDKSINDLNEKSL